MVIGLFMASPASSAVFNRHSTLDSVVKVRQRAMATLRLMLTPIRWKV